jgi:hypothetical protein
MHSVAHQRSRLTHMAGDLFALDMQLMVSHTGARLDLRRCNLWHLLPEGCLDDEVIDWYMVLLQAACTP